MTKNWSDYPATTTPVSAAALEDLEERVTMGVISVKDEPYNAAGDGVTNDATAIQSAIDVADNNGSIVYFPPGTYYLGATYLTASSSVSLVGASLGASEITYTTGALRIDGTVGSAVNLTAQCDEGDYQLTMGTTASFTAKGYALLCSTEDWSALAPGYKKGEIVRIKSKDSTTLTLDGHAKSTYTLATTANVRPLTLVDGPLVRDLTFRNTAASGTGWGIRFNYCLAPRCENLRFVDGFGAQLIMEACLDFVVRGCTFINGHAVVDSSAFGYGVMITGASQGGVVADCTSEVGHGGICTTSANDHDGLGGIPRNCLITDCTAIFSRSEPYHTHEACEFLTFANCIANGQNAGETGSETTYHYAFAITGEQCAILNPVVTGWYGNAIQLGGPWNVIRNAIVHGTESTPANYGIGIILSANADNCTIDGATLTNCAYAGVYMDGTSGCRIRNVYASYSDYGVYLTNIATDTNVIENVTFFTTGNADQVIYWGASTPVTPAAICLGIRGLNAGANGSNKTSCFGTPAYGNTTV